MIRAYIGRIPTGITEKQGEEIEVNVYPNPAHEQFTLALPQGGSYTMSLYDMTGKEIKTLQNLSGATTIDAAGLTKGIYLIRLQEAHGNGFASRRIILN
jgi:hypothetical protein